MPDARPAPRGRIDTHGHLLPNIDDGSRGYKESIAIARTMADAGYAVLACTPHIWPHQTHTPAFIRDRVQTLQGLIDGADIALKLVPGGELNLVDLDVFALEDDEIVTYGLLGKHVLFDFWDDEFPHDYWDRVKRLQDAGLTCIQAHPERIAAFQLKPALLDELAARGVLLQCNLQCLNPLAGSLANRRCVEWLRAGRYFMFGSDLHRIDSMDVRLDGLKRAIDLLGDPVVDRMTITNPAVALGLTID